MRHFIVLEFLQKLSREFNRINRNEQIPVEIIINEKHLSQRSLPNDKRQKAHL